MTGNLETDLDCIHITGQENTKSAKPDLCFALLFSKKLILLLAGFESLFEQLDAVNHQQHQHTCSQTDAQFKPGQL